jgi:hypothetical protein
VDSRGIQETDGTFERRGTQVHVPLRRGEILVPSQFLNRSRWSSPHRQMRAERMPQPMHPALSELSTPCGPFHMMLDHIGGES